MTGGAERAPPGRLDFSGRFNDQVGSSTAGIRSVKERLTLCRIQPIPNPSDRDQVHRSFRVRLELGSKPPDVDVDGASAAFAARPPHAVEQLAARVRTARVGAQHGQQAELLGAEVDDLPLTPQLVRSEIDRSSPSPTTITPDDPARARAFASSHDRRPTSSAAGVADVSVSSKPMSSAASRSSTASGGARWTARIVVRRRRSPATSSSVVRSAGGCAHTTIRGRSASSRSRNRRGSSRTRTIDTPTWPGTAEAGPSDARISHAAR